MTSPNKSTNKIEEILVELIEKVSPGSYKVKSRNEAVQQLNSLFKELAEEALPSKIHASDPNQSITAKAHAYNECIDQTKANINKLLGGGDE